MRFGVVGSILLCALVVARPAGAQGRSVADEARRQALLDVSAIPDGMAALLVPRPGAETEGSVLVFEDDQLVARGTLGRRIFVTPGAYRVVVGQGPIADRPDAVVEVIEGETVAVPTFFGAVRVHVVDEDGHAIEAPWQIVAEDGRPVLGGDSPRPGEPAGPRRVLQPGRYRVVLGSDPTPRRGSSAFVLAAGDALDFRIVSDGDEMLRTELTDGVTIEEPSALRLRWILGASGSFSHRQDTLTGFQGGALMLDGYTRFEGGIDSPHHLALLTINAYQSLVSLDSDTGADVPLRTINSDLEGEILYSPRLASFIGPYARGIVRTSPFRESFVPAEDSRLTTVDEQGNVLSTGAADANARVQLFDVFHPTSLQAGVGIGATPLENRYVSLALRGGAAARVATYGGGRFVSGVDGPEVQLTRIDDREGFGAEATAIGALRLGSIVSLESRFDSFLPGEQIASDEELRPLFRFDNTLAFRLSSFASAVYTFSLRREEVVFEDLQTAQNLSLRLHYALF